MPLTQRTYHARKLSFMARQDFIAAKIRGSAVIGAFACQGNSAFHRCSQKAMLNERLIARVVLSGPPFHCQREPAHKQRIFHVRAVGKLQRLGTKGHHLMAEQNGRIISAGLSIRVPGSRADEDFEISFPPCIIIITKGWYCPRCDCGSSAALVLQCRGGSLQQWPGICMMSHPVDKRQDRTSRSLRRKS